GDGFFFGLATAPVHVKDGLEDAWLQFAIEHSCDEKDAVCDQKTAEAVMVSAAGDRGTQLASSSRGEEKGGDAEKRKPLKVAMEAMLMGLKCLLRRMNLLLTIIAAAMLSQLGTTFLARKQEMLKFWSDSDIELILAN
ncbi:hypothetical protein U9M48_041433, partial [Paspalum notatum var. saurae]